MTHHILFEINELCPDLIERFENKGVLPNFKKYKSYFNRYKTMADAEPPALEPWIQWYSIHSGLPYSEHGVFRINEGAHAGYPSIWSVLKEKGFSVMNFGSINCQRLDGDNDIFLPDHWSHEQANPEILQPIVEFIDDQFRDYTTPNKPIDYMSLFGTLLEHGVTVTTAMMVFKQITQEKLRSKKYKYRRLFILDRILMDMFIYFHRLYKPNFATLYTNSASHIQNAYWRHYEPEKFNVSDQNPEFKNAVPEVYTYMDHRLGQLMRYALTNNIKVSIASGLSQRPYVQEEKVRTKRYYRPRNIDNLLEKLEIVPLTHEAVGEHEYLMRFRNLGAKKEAEKILGNSRLYDAGQASALFTFKDADNGIGIVFDCNPFNPVSMEAEVLIHGKEYPFEEIFYLVDHIHSGGHDPSGLYWEACEAGKGQPQEEVIIVHKLFNKILAHFED